MVPKDLLSFRFTEHEVIPSYFTAVDHVWLRALVDIYRAFDGKRRAELEDRLEDPLPMRAPLDKVRIARHVLDRLWRFGIRAVAMPREVRAVVFAEAARSENRERALQAACERLGVEREPLLESLFADLPDERIVTPPKEVPSIVELAQRANLSLVAGMLRRAIAVRIEGGSNLRRVVRQAKLKGLLCVVTRDGAARGHDRLEISGPYVLFRRTTLYGRALASLVPLAVQCDDIELRAACVFDDTTQTRTLVVRAGDPLFPSDLPPAHDSKLEERFARDFARLAPEWDVVREPAAVPAGNTLIFPDFELRHRWQPRRRWLLEICGFWTPSYVADKLRRLRAANLDRLILCLDDERNCADADLPEAAKVLRFRRRVDAAAVLAVIDPRVART
jgi:predicted nuclease of restriction endonuclease-like RecB superfamily